MTTEASILHTREQGVRVHVLANLGGLVAIAGLEHVEPDLLLGALLEVSERLPQMKPSLVERMPARGAAKLDERGSGKRAWRARGLGKLTRHRARVPHGPRPYRAASFSPTH